MDAAAWLATACEEPGRALAEWGARPHAIALARVGGVFDVVRTDSEIGLTVARDITAGPVLFGLARGVVYFLVPAGTAARWRVADTRTLAPGSWLPVPHPASPGTDLVTWLNPPDGRTLVDPAALRAAVRAADGGYAARHEARLEARLRALLPPPRHGGVPERAVAALLCGRSHSSPAQARRLVRCGTASWNVDADTADALQIVVSELVTNAVRHTDSPNIGLTVLHLVRHLKVAVADSGPHTRRRGGRAVTAALAESGRGLDLVEALSAQWGHRQFGAGSVTWARIALPDRRL